VSVGETQRDPVPGPAPAAIEATTTVDPEDLPSPTIAVSETEAESDSLGAIRSGKLAGMSMGRAIWVLAIPVLIQQTMQACVGMVDKMLAGRLPNDIAMPALDGIGVGSYVAWFIGIAMAGLGVGGQALIARGMGSGDRAESHRALGQSMMLSLVWGVVVGVILWFMVGLIARMCSLTGEAALFCTQYIQMIALSMPASAVMMVGWMCLHGAGETARPSQISVEVNIVNIVFAWALSGVDLQFGGHVLHNPFSFDLNVIGIGLGAALSNVWGALRTWTVLKRGVKDLRLEREFMTPDMSMVKRIVHVGVPSFLEGLSMWGVNLFVLIFIGWIEVARHASGGLQGAHIIAVQWEAFSFMPGFAIGTAAGALAGQYLGAGNTRMAERTIITCAALAATIMGLAGIVFMTQGAWLTRAISDQAVHLETVPTLLKICGSVQVFFAIMMVVRQGLRGVGDAKWTFIITTVSCYGIRLPAAWFLGVHLGYGLEGVWYALCGELVIRGALFCTRLFHGGWKRVRV
jgi:putative MATE family efflux protein